MARSSSSSRFVSVNLSKSYGQPSSPAAAHGGSISFASASSPSAYRTRSQSGHNGMVVLLRPGRSQPSASSTASRTSKLAVPSPVNLPSRRREHAGNDPTVALVGASGSAGWSKQQVSTLLGDSVTAAQSIPDESVAVRSTAMVPESSWSSPASQGRVAEQQEAGTPLYQAPVRNSTLYMPPNSRNATAFDTAPTQPSEKIMMVRGEDFPTLQAAARPFAVPTLHRQKDLQQKQRDKQQESKDQNTKLQQLSQQQHSKAEDVQTKHYGGPHLQPVRPPEIPKQPVGREGQSYEMRHAPVKRGSNSYGGPSPLISLTHTSNWADDERETLQNVRPQASMQSDRSESARPRNGYHLSDSWVSDHKGSIDSSHPLSRNGSLSGYGRGFRDAQDHDKDTGFGLEGRSTRDMGSRNGMVRSLSNKQPDADSWEDIASWSRGPSRNDPLKRGWSFSAKENTNDRDGRLGSSGRSFDTRNRGLEREISTNVRKDADLSYRGDNFGSTMATRDLHSRDSNNRQNTYFSKHGMNDQFGDRSRSSIGNYQLGSANLGRVQKDLSGLDYGREKRASSLYAQDPFLEEPLSSKPSSSIVLEAFFGMSGLEAKTTRRKKDASQNFHDPARELFEAELERVQRMQEQERKRVAEERERAIELARKEEEERERLAQEEELLALKMEEEAREAAAQAQRAAEEAVRKVEEIRRARDEEKRMATVEEERRKEAAKKKLLDLEQRMAQREALQQQRSFSKTEVSVGSSEGSRRLEEEETRALPSFTKADSNEQRALGIDSARPMLLESTVRLPADTRAEAISGDRNRVVQMKRRETLDDGPGLPLTVKKYPRDDPPWPEHEREYRGFSMRESSLGPNRSLPLGASRSSALAHGQERAHSDPFARNKSWQSGHSDRFLGGHFPTDINAGYIDTAIERDNDGWWARDDRRRFQEGQRLNSPPLPFHMNGGETDLPFFGRLRQSLPKQPRVPPPIFGRPTFHKPVTQSETKPSVSLSHPSDVSEGRCKDGSNFSGEEGISGNNPKKADHVDKLLIEIPVERKSELADDFVPPYYTEKVSDETEKTELKIEAQNCKDEMLQPDEIDELSEQLSDLTESEGRLGEDEKQMMVDVHLAKTVESADNEDGWLVQARAEHMDEEMFANKFEHEEAVEDASDEQEWDSSNILEDVSTNVEHGAEKGEVDEATWESQHIEDEGDGVVDDPEGAADEQWESNELFTPKIEKQDDTELKDIGVQEAVKDHVIQLQNVLSSANTYDYAQAGQSESHMHGQSFLHHFQQPFSFMAVPLPQSTALNGGTTHPSMLPSMHNAPSHQELPYHLHVGLLPGTPLMPNAIQIGSIQMPLQVHPQMPSVGHIHHQQPPVFQFGQLCPFSQPVPPMQPAVQMHHAIGQPPSAQHYQAEFLSPVEGSHLSKVAEAGEKPEEMAIQSSFGLPSDVKSSFENPADTLGGSLSLVEHVASPSITSTQNHLPSVEKIHNAAALQEADVSTETNQDTSVGKILGGRRRNSSAWTSAIYGRGRGRLHTGKNHDHKGPYSVSEPWPANEEVSRRTYRQNFRRAEYKIRKSLPTSESDPDFNVDQENHSSSYGKDVSTSDGLKNAQMSSTEDTLEMTSYLYPRSDEGSSSQHAEAVPRLRSPKVGFGSDQADVALTGIIRSANTITTSAKGNNFNSDDLRDRPLQSGVAFVYEEQGSDVQNEKDDDFIEVRSKRQLLREQRELRDKAKSRELKVKEQIARKQQKVLGKPVLHEEAANNQGRAAKQSPAVIGFGLQPLRATPTSIGLSAPSEPKVSISGQYQPEAVASHADPGKGHTFEQRYGDDALDTSMSVNAAWGVQRSSHEVVSLTQIQLEETMKPFRFERMPSQLAAPIAERAPTVMEQGMSLTSCSLDTVSAPVKAVSMPGPISSLLAGEKIQFGAVTSPTVISSPSHPPSPSFVGAIGSQLGADLANFSSHSLSHTRNYFGPDMNGGFLSSKMITRAEDDANRQLADSEAEAEAAASAIAVAAISNDEAVGNHSDASPALDAGAPAGAFSSFPKSTGLDGTGAGIIQAPIKSLGVDDSISVALPIDLSLETSAPLLQDSLPSHPISSDIMMQSLPSRASPFPCLEMGTILGGPIFAYGPREDAPMSSFEPGFAGMGAGNIAGWQHRHSNTSDSFYGAPPPFMNPAGLPSIQGHPHMLVYTNPFAPVGQFGQLGVSFMGTAYHPSGKQPDWTHTPYTTSPGSLNQSGGEMNAGLPVMMDLQHNGIASNSAQAISVAGCSMIPVPAPMSHFDPNFSTPYQAQWSRAPTPPFSSYHNLSGLAPGLNLQSRASVVPNELGRLSQAMHASDNPHQLADASGLRMSGDAAAATGIGVPGVNFRDELGFGYSVLASNSGLNNAEVLLNRGLCAGSTELAGINLQQGQIIPQNAHGTLNLAPVSGRNEAYLGTHDARGSHLEASHAQISDLEQQGALSHYATASPVMDKRAPQDAQARGSGAGADYQRRLSSRAISTVSGGERGPASSLKAKQIYVAKPAAPVGAT